jgi:hypothetical protein
MEVLDGPFRGLHLVQSSQRTSSTADIGKVNEDDGEQNEDMVCDRPGVDAGMGRPL